MLALELLDSILSTSIAVQKCVVRGFALPGYVGEEGLFLLSIVAQV